jgi:hypothetical protein
MGGDSHAGGYALDEPPDHPVVTLVGAPEVALRWDEIVLDRACVERLVEQLAQLLRDRLPDGLAALLATPRPPPMS